MDAIVHLQVLIVLEVHDLRKEEAFFIGSLMFFHNQVKTQTNQMDPGMIGFITLQQSAPSQMT
jgi:hypothetical protein